MTTTDTLTCPTPGATTAGPLLPVVGSDTLVPLVDGRSVPYANLDVAASAPALRSVADRVAEVLPLYASVHRGAGYLSQVSTALYEASRQAVGAFLGARDEDVTIVVRNTTDATNLLAGCVPPAASGAPGRVLVLDAEHHANLLPWRGVSGADVRATTVEAAPSVVATLHALHAELAAAAAAGDPYALVAVTGASNVTGESLPVADVVALAHDAGARVFFDGAQLVPHRRFSLAATDVDYVAFSGHKTYAPYGAGALVGRRDWLDAGTPYLAGGGAVRNVTVDDVTWQAAPARHEAGSPNVLGAEYLSAEHGIGVRDGRFCAHPLLRRLGHAAGAIRASVGVGTAGEEVERLLAALETFVTDGPGATYAVVDGLWIVEDDPRPLPEASGLSGLVATAAAGFIAESAGCGPALD
jgi:selenocysteine lyase/cysteine desulfurase